MNKRKLIAYVAGPYRSSTEWGVKENIARAEKVAADLWEAGYTVICPQKNTAFFGGLLPDKVWLEGDMEILRRCDFVVLVPGWERSEGAMAEAEEAHNLGIPVFLWHEIRDVEEWMRGRGVVEVVRPGESTTKTKADERADDMERLLGALVGLMSAAKEVLDRPDFRQAWYRGLAEAIDEADDALNKRPREATA